MFTLDLDAMNAPEFSEYANMVVATLDDGEFMVGMEYNFKKSVISTIRNYTISREVVYAVHVNLNCVLCQVQ
ncbi:hypothetical protein PIB30_000295 [Stylosanthes scabra]|uniref:Uncharacterized protein n=1 Tax=Stylosanthes scabra TaxID=79078 RepID=A0ABU6T304_9FABA|nr:hypothetical protein [Stylosanthes scabra]